MRRQEIHFGLFHGERVRSFNPQYVETLRTILRVDFHMDECFEQGRGSVQGAIDDWMAFCMPTPRHIQTACSVQSLVVADPPQDHRTMLTRRIRNRVAEASLLPVVLQL